MKRGGRKETVRKKGTHAWRRAPRQRRAYPSGSASLRASSAHIATRNQGQSMATRTQAWTRSLRAARRSSQRTAPRTHVIVWLRARTALRKQRVWATRARRTTTRRPRRHHHRRHPYLRLSAHPCRRRSLYTPKAACRPPRPRPVCACSRPPRRPHHPASPLRPPRAHLCSPHQACRSTHGARAQRARTRSAHGKATSTTTIATHARRDPCARAVVRRACARTRQASAALALILYVVVPVAGGASGSTPARGVG